MPGAVVVLNAGSSSIKFSLFVIVEESHGQSLRLVVRGQVEGLHTHSRFVAHDAGGVECSRHEWSNAGGIGHEGAVAHLVEFLRERASEWTLRAVGHRVVHGGLLYSCPVIVDATILDSLARLNPLAPLHQPHNLAPIRMIAERLPNLPQVACFDTAFHRSQPEVAQAYALPPDITERGVRRYGFHGLSYEYVAEAIRRLDPEVASGRVVVAHLGNGSSMCAMLGCRSMATTMGFTAVDGLPMGTRCGSVDPGLVLYLMDELKMDLRAIEKLIYTQSGLLGVSGISSDMRALLTSRDPRAAEAVDLFVYRIGRELGSLAAAVGGLDGLVLTAGIGEHAAPIRSRIGQAAAWLGVEVDESANSAPWREEGWKISTPGSRVAVWVIPTNEELMIARHTLERLAAPAARAN
ncbi:MAG: acetate/propionate family kinase [Phycisphaeraceae bacterium]|nr:acetate/propionate family kinase [Phycisphaeraceae bacterium]